MRLLSKIGYFVGAEIEVAPLEEKSSQLSEELEARKIVERDNGILPRARLAFRVCLQGA